MLEYLLFLVYLVIITWFRLYKSTANNTEFDMQISCIIKTIDNVQLFKILLDTNFVRHQYIYILGL